MSDVGRRRRRRRGRVTILAERLHDVRGRVATRTAPVRHRLRFVTDFVSPLGFLAAGAAVFCLVLGASADWAEFTLAGYVLVVVLALCVALTVGRTDLEVSIALNPNRVFAGGDSYGRVEVRNLRRGRLLPLALELPVGSFAGRFNMPSLRGGGRYGETFHVPTTHRGVVPVGPATTVRGDPFGLVRRTVRWTQQLELFVHPRLVPVGSLDSGLLRDLEGQTTTDLSVSDLAFHALREYVPGDDRRFIHWRSTAKASAGVTGSKFLVRQFLDTRRSHLCVVVDADDRSYDDEADFEAAISAGASVAVRAIRDDVDATVVVGRFSAHEGTEARTLDTFARAVAHRAPLAELTAGAGRLAPATSIALIVTGRHGGFEQLRRATANFSSDVAVVVLRVDPTARVGRSTVHGMTLLTMTEPADLSRLLGAQA